MQKIEKNGLTVYEFSNIAAHAGVRHGVFSRHGGNSRGAFSSLNVAFGVGDKDEAVLENRLKIAGYFKDAHLIFADQVHGRKVHVIDTAPVEHETTDFACAGEGDALITNAPGVDLVIQVADCQAVMLYDPGTHSIANIHVGWRGNVQNIIGHTIEAMQRRYRTAPVDLSAGIGPSLGPCCAEFLNYRREIPETYWDYKDYKQRFDLWAVSFRQLREAGVRSENIVASGLCTRCHSDTFFSYRARKETGRFAAVIGLT